MDFLEEHYKALAKKAEDEALAKKAKETVRKFEFTINVGHIIAFVAFLFAVYLTYATLDAKVSTLETRLTIPQTVETSTP